MTEPSPTASTLAALLFFTNTVPAMSLKTSADLCPPRVCHGRRQPRQHAPAAKGAEGKGAPWWAHSSP